MKILCLLLLISASLCVFAENAPRQVFIKKAAEYEQLYVLDLLTDLLNSSGKPRNDIIEFPEQLTKARLLKELRKGFIDVAWTAKSHQFSNHAIEIPTPLFNNLFGHRLLLIRDGEQEIFNRVENLSDLQNLIGGLGTFWNDTKILNKAGLNIKTASVTSELINMLMDGRIDYFPRALHEAWYERHKNKSLNLAVEQKLVLIYEQPIYFYVSLKNTVLAEQLARALNELRLTGKLQSKFQQNYAFQNALNLSDLKSRKAIYLSPEKFEKRNLTQVQYHSRNAN